MRLLVLFDLPTTTKAHKKAYVQFRRFLIKDGYDMLQWSVYTRLTNGFDQTQTHLKRLKNNLPKEGSIRCIELTEKQFTQMKVLLGERKIQEKVNTHEQFLLF